jgi:hypothetical protein
MPGHDLDVNQANTERELRERVAEFWLRFHADDIEAALDLLPEMANMALCLQKSLVERGIEPAYPPYLLENRGTTPDKERFFYNIHPIESLLAFVERERQQIAA